MNNKRYSGVAVVLHWLVALGILYNLIAMLVVDDDARGRPFIELHKSIGISVLGLVLLRILWRAGHKPPVLLPSAPWERVLATGVHHLLYLLMVLVPLSGWLMNSASLNKATGLPYGIDLFHVVPWFNLPFFGAMWVALALHIAGALKHQFMDRQKLLQRMWFGR